MFLKSILIMLFLFPSVPELKVASVMPPEEITCIYCHYCTPRQYVCVTHFGDGSSIKTNTSIYVCEKTDKRMWVSCQDFKWVPEQIHVDSLYFSGLFTEDGQQYIIMDTTYTMDTTCVERMDIL